MSDSASKVNTHVSEVVAKLASDIDRRMSDLATKKDFDTLTQDLLEFRAVVEAQLKAMSADLAKTGGGKKKAAPASPEPAGTDSTPAAAPAIPAAAKPKKPVGASPWFKEKYAADPAFRTRVDALPAAAALLARSDIAAMISAKKADNTKIKARAAALCSLDDLVKSEHDNHLASMEAKPEGF